MNTEQKMPPLTIEQIERARDDARQAFRYHQGSIRGQMCVPADDPEWHFAHAVCAARDQQWAERVAELERDLAEWKDACITANTRFQQALVREFRLKERAAELERVLGVALENILRWKNNGGAKPGYEFIDAALSAIDAVRGKEGVK